jgi:hypothetical protein
MALSPKKIPFKHILQLISKGLKYPFFILLRHGGNQGHFKPFTPARSVQAGFRDRVKKV